MLPDLPSRNSSIMTNTARRRKDVKSPKTSRDYKVDVLTNQLSPHQKFKPIDFKDNLIISIASTEAMRVKEYDRLCQIVTKFEHKKVRENLVKTKEKKDFGHYAQKKGFNIMRKFEVLQNQRLIEQLKCRTSMGIVRWKENEKSNIKGIIKPGIKTKRILSESRKNIDSDGDIIRQDVGFETTDFFKTLVTGKVKTDKDEKLKDLDPDQKKKIFEKLSSQRHFMMPLEIKQIKNALQKEETMNPIANNLFIHDFSNIQGASPVVESPRGYNDFDLKYFSKYQPDPFKTLSPRLKEMVVSNKDALKEILIKNNDKLKKILNIQKQSELNKHEQPSAKLYKTMLKEAITSRTKFSIIENDQQRLHNDSIATEDNDLNSNPKWRSARQQSLDFRSSKIFYLKILVYALININILNLKVMIISY